MLRVFATVLAALALGAGAAQAQKGTRELDLDFRPFAGTLSMVWSTADLKQGWGIAAGGGIDELDRTLIPDTDDEQYSPFYQLMHVGGLYRYRPSQRWDLDFGIRVGLGDVRECTASDCWPGGFVGVYVAPMWGGRRFKVGPRIMMASSRYNDRSDFVLYTEVLNGRVAFRW